MNARFLHRMQRVGDPPATPAPDGVAILPYAPDRDHARVPLVYAAAFGAPPWPGDWDRFPEFDPRGVFVAETLTTGEAIGFVTCFRRRALPGPRLRGAQDLRGPQPRDDRETATEGADPGDQAPRPAGTTA